MRTLFLSVALASVFHDWPARSGLVSKKGSLPDTARHDLLHRVERFVE